MSNKYTVDLAGMRVVQIASMENPELDAKFINNAYAIADHIKADAEYQLHIRSLPSYPLQSVPEGWVQDMVVAPEDFEIGWQVYDDELRQWEDCAEWYYNSINGVRRIIAIPILQTGITIAPAAGTMNMAPSVRVEQANYMQIVPDSHFWTSISMLMEWLKHHSSFTSRERSVEHLVTGLQNTLENGYDIQKLTAGKEDEVGCTHEALIIAGDATEVYYCPVCKESWTKAEWDNINAPDSYWKKRAHDDIGLRLRKALVCGAANPSMTKEQMDDYINNEQQSLTSPVAEAEGQDELKR